MGDLPTVVSVGDLVADLVVEIPRLPVRPDEHQIARSLCLQPGGAGNFLIAGARLGMHMLAMGCLGDDPYGRQVMRTLRDEGVDVDTIAQPTGSATTIVLVLVDSAGGHVFLGVAGQGPPVPLTQEWVDRIERSDALFTSCFALVEEQLGQLSVEAMGTAHRCGIPVFLDPGPMVTQVPEEILREAVRRSTVLLLTEEEASLMSGHLRGEEAARSLREMGPGIVVLKRGGNGCLVITPDRTIDSPAFTVPVRDTTAAGDSFDAAFIYGYLHGYSLSQTAVLANAMGAAKVQKVGSGTEVPTAEEVMAVLHHYGAEVDFPAKGGWRS